MKISTLIAVTIFTAFVGCLAALYVGYLMANKQLHDTANKNPLLGLIFK